MQCLLRNGSTAYPQPLMTGIRAIDSVWVLTCGEGQRWGFFLLTAWGKARFWRCCVMRQTRSCNVLVLVVNVDREVRGIHRFYTV